MATRISEGGCLCAAIRFRIAGAPRSSFVCHCDSCRRASGACAVAWLTVERAQLEFLSGSPRRYASSPGVIRSFCGICGSQIHYENTSRPHTIDIASALLDEPSLFPPTEEVWLERKVSWQTTNPMLVQHQQDTAD